MMGKSTLKSFFTHFFYYLTVEFPAEEEGRKAEGMCYSYPKTYQKPSVTFITKEDSLTFCANLTSLVTCNNN